MTDREVGHPWPLAATKVVYPHLRGPVGAGPPPAQPAEAESSGEAVGPATGVGARPRASPTRTPQALLNRPPLRSMSLTVLPLSPRTSFRLHLNRSGSGIG